MTLRIVPTDEAAPTPLELGLDALRSDLVRRIRFDLYRSGDFAEALVCHVAQLTQTHPASPVDGVADDGLRVEVKYASAKAKKGEPDLWRMCFRNLDGSKPGGKRADVFVFVGLLNNRLMFFVMPSDVLGDKRDLDILLGGARLRKWAVYEVPLARLGEAISEAASLGAMYRGLYSGFQTTPP